MKSGVYASLDIGTTSIKVIVAEVKNDQLNIIGVGSEPSTGVSRGMIVDIEETVDSIKKAVKQAEEQSGTSIRNVVVGIPSNSAVIDHCYGSVSVENPDQEITASDVKAVIDRATSNVSPNDNEIISVHAHEFIVDGFDGIQDPRGMIGKRLEIDGTVTSVSKSVLHNFRRSTQRAGLGIRQFILYPEAMGKLALTEDERRFGTVLIDMGGGQTSASAIHDDELKYTKVISEGGQFVTQDISIVLNTSVKNAEQLKKEVGQAYYDLANDQRTISVDIVGQKEPTSVKETYIAEIIEARLLQIFEQLKAPLDEIQALELPGGIVVSGGASSIPGVEALMEEYFKVPVKKYVPDFMGVRYPSYTNAIGLAVAIAKQSEVQTIISHVLADHLGLENASSANQDQQYKKASGTSQSKKTQSQTLQTTNADSETAETSESFTDRVKNFFADFFE